MNAVRGLKLLSAVMALLIVGGLGLLGYGVYSKLGGSVKGDAQSVAEPAAESTTGEHAPVGEPVAVGAALASFGALGLDQPSGSRIAAAATDGPLMTLRIEGGGQDDRVVIVDMRAGRVIGVVHVGASGQ